MTGQKFGSCANVKIASNDSAIAYSWHKIDIAAGETKVYSVRLTLVVDKGGNLDAIIY